MPRDLLTRLARLRPAKTRRRLQILYVSVHQILEYDELSLFDSIGCDVFPLGAFFAGRASQPFRPLPPLPAQLNDMMARFEALGGRYRGGPARDETVIPREFVSLFDIVVVMHNCDFIDRHWDALSRVPVIWRSIGVGTQMFEPRVADLRRRGVAVVRYSPAEARADGYAGHDAVIRFGKVRSPERWSGDRAEILTFAHSYAQRYPAEYAFFVAATAAFDTAIGGTGNDLPDAVGVVTHDRQIDLLRHCAAYFYASGSWIPYTLNFIEAWLAGIPVVAVNCRRVYSEAECIFAEIPDLIEHGVDGFLVDTPEDAAATFRLLSDDRVRAREIGARGAATAASLFSAEVVAPQWRALFDRILGH